MRVLISGAGIAGLTAAYWLHQYGFEIDIVERSSGPQDRLGYAIDFWGPGFSVLEKMNLAEKLQLKNNALKEFVFINEQGIQESSFSIPKLRQLLNNRVFAILRGDLEKGLLDVFPNQLNIQYGTFVDHLIDQGDNVVVTFNNKIEKTYDLVIGADGIHSHTREIIFGDENQFSKDLRYQLAATIQPNNVDIIDSFYTYSTFDKQVAICPIRNNQLSVYFIYRNEEKKLIDPKEKLYDAFKNDGWIIPRILESTLKSETIIFDHLSQIQMPSWYRGRVVLVGDACQCLTLVSGQGASMAMAGAYILATLLHQHSHNFQEALIQYQTIMKPDIDRKQTVAREFLNTFVLNPESAQLSRNYFTRQFFKSMYVKSAVDEFCR